MISISPGHFGPKTGASGFIDEVTEAIKVCKRVTAILKDAGIHVNYIEDNVSKDRTANIKWLVNAHNKSSRNLDVSVHFNASSGSTNKGIGTETLVFNESNKKVAQKVNDAIVNASGLINRGVKLRTDLGFLKGTNKPSILIEVCFVNSSVDVALYRRDFEKICLGISTELAAHLGKTLISNKPTLSSTVDSDIQKRAKALIQKAVDKKVFNKDSHKDLNKYTDEQLLRYLTILGERLL